MKTLRTFVHAVVLSQEQVPQHDLKQFVQAWAVGAPREMCPCAMMQVAADGATRKDIVWGQALPALMGALNNMINCDRQPTFCKVELHTFVAKNTDKYKLLGPRFQSS